MTDRAVDTETTRRECLPLAAAVRDQDGWTTKTALAHQFDLRPAEVVECLTVLQEADDVEVADLGRITLLVAPAKDIDVAIAELFDEHEREWRAQVGAPMPDREQFEE
jgi:hypothetical protein